MTDFLVRKEAARYLQSRGLPVETKTLSNMAHEKRGPKFAYWGKKGKSPALYTKEDLDAWIQATLQPADIQGVPV